MFGDRKTSPYYAPWRVDCRLARELPDDKPVRSHFLVQLVAVLLCAVLGLVVGWQYYRLHELRAATQRWNRIIAENREAYAEVQRTRSVIAADAKRIENASTLLRTHMLGVEFLAGISHTRPDNLRNDQIATTENGLVMRGGLDAAPEKAARQLGRYVADLRIDPRIGPHFGSILLRAMDRRGDGESAELQYEITFIYR
jgi:hypothetical protein